MTVLLLICSIAFFIGFMTIVRFSYMDHSKKNIENEFRKAIEQASTKNHRTVILPNHEKTFNYVKPIQQKLLSMKEAIERALPNTPAGCMWSVRRIKTDGVEVEFITPDSSSKILFTIDNSMSRQDIIDCLVSEIEHQCPALVNEYMNRTDDWDGVYIKNEEE